jgi:hypothetical protein
VTPTKFAAKWRGVTTGERASAQFHFLTLRLTSLDPAAKADLPPLARDRDLGSPLQRAENEILHIAEKIGQEEQLQRQP